MKKKIINYLVLMKGLFTAPETTPYSLKILCPVFVLPALNFAAFFAAFSEECALTCLPKLTTMYVTIDYNVFQSLNSLLQENKQRSE